ncbi:MAG: hypothetical protein VB934_22055 [Polyangiaceae bacterium]
MQVSLQNLLASEVIDALQAREHVLLAPGGRDALRCEMEILTASRLPAITPHLAQDHAVTGELTNTFGHDEADEAVETLVHDIAEQLMASEHVDDIFAEDRIIRRDAFRAIASVLSRYQRGELDITESSEAAGQTPIALNDLGYVAATVAQTADEDVLTLALEAAASSVDSTLCRLDGNQQAYFVLSGTDANRRLALEEAITEALVDLVDQELVELPSVEQVLQVDEDTAKSERFAEGVMKAVRHTQQQTGCAVTCSMVDNCTLLASLTPLTGEDAETANEHFDLFLQTLEDALSRIDAAH